MVEYLKAKYSDRALVGMAREILRRLLEAETPALREIAASTIAALQETKLDRNKQ
jgi:hypothetical protein